ncbi:MAG: nucleotidyltransferase family protein [Alphaproteobacteria bacterium]|nr:nucleotidyltransferase family protein [Alphaproteobacteria bacterium]HPF46912.1 nucleotidyltransferase family protein [Emcibacteraceae bacterium]HRW28900.1 nucleotidyltransferase family protein [Emcibacteraceae bacterium]
MSARITAIVLAAGKSTRMGEDNKLLLTFNDKTMVSHVIDQLMASNLDDIIVVTGHEHEKVKAGIGQPVKFTHNPDYDIGLSASLKAGMAALHKDCDGVMICLGDMPYISSAHYKRLISEFQADKIVAPTRHGKIGNPIIFSSKFFPDFDTLQGDKGARKLLQNYQDDVISVDLETDAILNDIDTPDSYNQIMEQF